MLNNKMNNHCICLKYGHFMSIFWAIVVFLDGMQLQPSAR
jgi:hypothetical protein